MKALFGFVGLLVVLAIVMVAARKQLQATGAAPDTTAGEHARQIEGRVRDDVQKALQQGADRAASDPP